MIWLLVAAGLVLGFVLWSFVPWRLELSIQGRGAPDGTWVLGGGGRFGPVALSAAAARGVQPRAQAHLFGRTVWQRSLGDSDKQQSEPDERSLEERLESVTSGYSRLERWFDPDALVSFALEERRRVRVQLAQAHVQYSFADVATTGKLMAALYVLSGVLPPPLLVTQDVSWESEDRAALDLSLEARVWPLLLMFDALWFGVRHIKLIKRR
ncbi:MAG: hypothetical protein KC492_05505, partial [Myxococcales bacterium]|nr:hypothetical protein [Myxococcales bacterium]